MHILLAGASGLIGQALTTQLLKDGHKVLCAGRSSGDAAAGMTWLEVDFARPPGRDWWLPHLAGVDVVINAVGVFVQTPVQTFDAIHALAPAELFSAAAQAQVGLVIQLSALGSDAGATTEFLASKHQADQTLRHLPISSVIVQPSLVYAPFGASATLFNRLALLSIVALPATNARVQPVHLDDLVEAVARLIDAPPASSLTLTAVGPQAMTLREYIAALRRTLGVARSQWVLPVPMGLAMAAVKVLERIRPGLVSASALTMLAQGSQGNASMFARNLGHPPRPVARFLGSQERGVVREHAQLRNWLAAMKAALVLVWIVTGLLSLGLYPADRSLALLRDFGVHGLPAWWALYAGAALDIALGLALALATPRFQAWVLGAQMGTMLGYTLLITLRIPEWWLHPFGPVLKNLPMLVATGMLMAFAPRR